jgi:phosphoribosylanthranilate isomerase
VLVKICGITRAEDAKAAVAAGAGAVGFIFWPGSVRSVEPRRVREIVAGIPPFVTTVGVFVNQTLDEIHDAVEISGVSAVQLHGDEEPSFAAAVRRPVIKALDRVSTDVPEEWPEHVMLLIDAHDPVRRGGTGERADWEAAARLSARRRVMLAGGLNPGNVADAVARVQPFGIDLSSGVEARPGIKDPAKLTALFEALHRS